MIWINALFGMRKFKSSITFLITRLQPVPASEQSILLAEAVPSNKKELKIHGIKERENKFSTSDQDTHLWEDSLDSSSCSQDSMHFTLTTHWINYTFEKQRLKDIDQTYCFA